MLEGNICCRAYTTIRRLCRQLRVSFEELLGRRRGATHPKSLEDFARHLDHGLAELRRRPRVLNDCNRRLEELLNELGEVCAVLVHEAYEADQASDHRTRLGLTR